MATLQEILAPQVIFKSITSRVKPVGDVLQRFWGLDVGTSNVEDIPGRVGSYDVFDSVRSTASIRAPMAGPGRSAPQPVAQQPVTCARIFEAIPLFYDRIFPLRQLGKPSSEVDKGGMDYVTRQEGILRRKVANTREFLVAGMMRGTCQILASGDNWTPVFTGGTHTIDWQVPASNKTNLNMTGGGAIIGTLWSDTTNATIFEDVHEVNAAFWQQHGYPLKHVWINSTIWGYVTNNAGLKARAGSANLVFSRYDGLGQDGKGAYTTDEYIGELRCLPGILWHVYDGGLDLNGTFTKFFTDTGAGSAVFCPEPSPDLVAAIRGSEWVQENEASPAQERRGPYFWPTYYREPARIELNALDLFFPALRVPKAIAVGTVA